MVELLNSAEFLENPISVESNSCAVMEMFPSAKCSFHKV